MEESTSPRTTGFEGGQKSEAEEKVSEPPPSTIHDSPFTIHHPLIAALRAAGMDRGFALVIGDGDGAISRALAANTQLRIVIPMTDEAAASALRENLLAQTAFYGSRIEVQVVKRLDQLPFAQYFANAVLVAGPVPGLSAKELYRVLRPCGGMLMAPGLGLPEAETLMKGTGAADAEVQQLPGGRAVVRGKLPGALDWDSKGMTLDQRVKWPLRPLWYGGPGTWQVQGVRACGGPVVANGRYVVMGEQSLTAVDAYNGAILWSHPLPPAAPDYCIVDGVILPVEDMEATERGLLLTLATRDTLVTRLDAWELYFDFRPPETRYGLYERGTFQTRITVAQDKDASPLCTPGNGPLHPALDVAGTRDAAGTRTTVLLTWAEIEKLAGARPSSFGFAATLNAHDGGREEPIVRRHLFCDWMASGLNSGWACVVLDGAATPAETGKRPAILVDAIQGGGGVNGNGDHVTPSRAVLHLGVSASGARYDALSRDDGKEDSAWNGEWKSAVLADQPPATTTPAGNPTVPARSLTAGDEDVAAADRPTLTLETDLPMTNALPPDPTSLVIELAIPWKTLEAAGLDKERLGVNVQMNQKDTSGQPASPGSMPNPKSPGTSGEALCYLGITGRERCLNFAPLGLGALPPAAARSFTVRLHFAELDDVKPGERVFDVKLQGETVLKAFDVVKEAGGVRTALVREFKSVRAGEALSLEFVSSSAELTATSAPILSAMEVRDEGFQVASGQAGPR